MLLLRARCLPSPCGRLSRPRTTMQAPPPPASRADDGPAHPRSVEGRRRRVPTFTPHRWADEVPGYAPAASPWVRRSSSPWPPCRRHINRLGSSPRMRVRAAPQPISARLELVVRLERSYSTGSLRTPFRLACRTRAVWQCRPVPSLSGLLATFACVSRVRLPSASRGLLRQPTGGVLSPPLGRRAPRGALCPRTMFGWDGRC